NATKSWIKVSLANLSVFRDPGRHALMVVTFDQHYRSSNLAQKSRKRQYWVIEEGRWKIAYEAPVGRPVLALPESYPRSRAQPLPQGKRS
ncbi:MAG: L,D-transpeptidase Cds6 family protein, partial [Burkholderiales bacterium]